MAHWPPRGSSGLGPTEGSQDGLSAGKPRNCRLSGLV
jgi:hypothetical protein